MKKENFVSKIITDEPSKIGAFFNVLYIKYAV